MEARILSGSSSPTAPAARRFFVAEAAAAFRLGSSRGNGTSRPAQVRYWEIIHLSTSQMLLFFVFAIL